MHDVIFTARVRAFTAAQLAEAQAAVDMLSAIIDADTSPRRAAELDKIRAVLDAECAARGAYLNEAAQ